MDVWSLGKREEINVRAVSLEMVFKTIRLCIVKRDTSTQKGALILGGRGWKKS